MDPQKPKPSHDDPPRDATIARWFAALGPPPTGAAPPHLQAKVRARLAQSQAQQGLGAWLSRLGLSPGGWVLAAGLVLSLGLHVWWGWHTLGRQVSGVQQGPAARQEAGGTAPRLSIARWQRQIQPAHALGTFVAAHSALQEPATFVTFTPQAARSAFVHLGTLYAEALATLASGDMPATVQRLDVLGQLLARVQAPPALPHYLRAVHTLLQQGVPGEDVATMLALFEPLYDDAYAGAPSPEPVHLFRAGAWLENMALAAAARDVAALRSGGAALEAVRRTLTRVQAPPEVFSALAQVQHLLTQPGLTEDELRTTQNLVQTIHARLRD